jgi:hypothetical protein
MVAKFDSSGQANTAHVQAAALRHLGPEIEVTMVQDNADAPAGYGETVIDNCWRAYYALRQSEHDQVGGDSPYILIEKVTHRVVGRGIESGE